MNTTINHITKANQPAASKAVGWVGGGLSPEPRARAPDRQTPENFPVKGGTSEKRLSLFKRFSFQKIK